MSNETTLGVPAVEVILDRPRRAVLNLAALRRIKNAPDMGLEVLDKLEGDGLLDHIDGVLWAALADDDPDLSREQVAGMIHIGNLPHIVAALNELTVASFPDAAPLETAPKRKPAKAKGKKPA